MRSTSGLFHVHNNAKSVNQFPAGKRKFWEEMKTRQCREDAAVNYSPAILSPKGAVAPNEGCITGIFSYLMTEGEIKYADTIGLSILFCLQQKKSI